MAALPARTPFSLRSMPGFRLLDPAIRPAKDGAVISVAACRVVGWAALSPPSVHILRQMGDNQPPEHRDIGLSRLGMRSGENCSRISAKFDGPPRPTENIAICLGWSHRYCEAGPPTGEAR